MKTRIIMNVFLTSVLLLCCVSGYAQKAGDPSGVWTYLCPDAPYDYQSGKVEFKKDGDRLTVAMVINGTSGKAITVTKKDNTYSWPVLIDGYDIIITVKPDGDELKGLVVSDGWEMPISAKPHKQ